MTTMAVAAPLLVTHDPGAQYAGFVLAPPMRPRLIDAAGHWRRPFIVPLRLADRLSRRYELDHARAIPITFFRDGQLASVEPELWFPLGTDLLGRDVWSRLLYGARLSLGVASVATAGALLLGIVVGGVAGAAAAGVDTLLTKLADLVLALPAIYVALALRAALPLVLTTPVLFWTLSGVLALAGWPVVARGVRGIVAGERRREYAEAARAIGAGRTRILLRHLLPAARSFVGVQAALLVPAFIVAEATLSYIGLGFPPITPSWGVMLKDSSEGRLFVESPWLMAPAIAIAITVLSVNLLGSRRTQS
ncbi:MAG: ABC transporter permease [Vicinamibacterales bacterium]